MAKVKYGEMIADLRGKINGTVHSKNRAGNYMRNKTSPVNPQSVYQSAVRTLFTTLSQGWRGLAVEERASWNAVVSSFARSNQFGDMKNMSGENLYISINRNLQTVGAALLTTPPLPAAVTGLSALSLVAEVSVGTMLLTYAPAIPATGVLLIFATPPVSAGISFVKNRYRFIDSILTANASPYNITSAYELKYGTGWQVAGQKVFVKCVPMIKLSGIVGAGRETSSIVIA